MHQAGQVGVEKVTDQAVIGEVFVAGKMAGQFVVGEVAGCQVVV